MEPVLEVKDLKKYFPVRSRLFSKTRDWVYAVDGVSFAVERGETLGLVGESGCGKSTAGRAILRLIEPTAGHVFLEGVDLCALDKHGLRDARRRMQLIFQDPFGSLNPKRTIGRIISEPLDNYNIDNAKTRKERVAQLLIRVGLKPEHIGRYPKEFSGGQRQRIGIARALALRPKLIIGDEPVSALDVSIQSQVLNLLKDLQAEYGLSYIFISHDLSVVRYISDRIAVMYLGRLVELAPGEELYREPLHPYTKALLSSIPIPDTKKKARRLILQGDVPSPIHPPTGCRFHPRCPVFQKDQDPICRQETPEFREKNPGRWVACHYSPITQV
jgi:oligopeptide/dipeptide ABC transporter ATP-binding protein